MSSVTLGALESAAAGIVDSHVHFWDPSVLRYPWLSGLPALDRPFLPTEYASATAGIAIDGVIVVEANALADQNLREVDLFENQWGQTPLISGIVAHASLTTPGHLDRTLEALSSRARVTGIRHNIQGEAPGFCTQASFVDGVRRVGARGLTFDLCATHDQLPDVLELVRACPDTRFVLDHCGKPAVRAGLLDPWRRDISCLAECENVWCKLSGLVTEAAPGWQEADLVPYASHAVDRFGTDRVMYGSDWPVLTLGAKYEDWFRFTDRFTASWNADERRGFYRDNARRAYTR